MFKETLSNILNVEVYAIIGFFIFFTFFIIVSIQAFMMKKDEVDKISCLPLEDSLDGKEQGA
jgi:hypothetical protein